MPSFKKHLRFSALIEAVSSFLKAQEDSRQQGKVNHSLHDVVMSGLACMFFQHPSLLHYQRELEKKFKRNNLMTQFNIKTTPSDTVIREVLDVFNRENFSCVFKDFITRLQRGKQMEKYEFLDGLYLMPIDGTQFYSSKNISCSSCLTKEKRGSITYSHQAVQAAIVHPDIKYSLPLMPEEIRNTDGKEKQDCEINAAKRLMVQIKKSHPRLHFIRTGDSLYAKQPFIEDTLRDGDSFFFSVKPDDHKKMYEHINTRTFEKSKEIDIKGRTLIYEWLTDVTLNGNEETIQVNYFRARMITPQKDKEKNTSSYIGSWITNLPINSENIALFVRGARSRWRIENECFNTLKNHGYELEHSYGHGKKHLCFNFYILTVLAFFMHQILELTDFFYKKARKSLWTLKNFWQRIRVSMDMFVFDKWEYMLYFTVDSEKYMGGNMAPCIPPPCPVNGLDL